MSLLDIDFAAAPRRGPGLSGLLLLLAGAIVLTLVSLELDDLDQETVVAEAKLRSLMRKPAATPGSKNAVQATAQANNAAQAEASASQTLARLQTPWPELLAQLEAMADLPVAVLDLDAQARGRTLRLSAEAKTIDDMLTFVETLRQSRRLDEVFLLGHELRKVGAVEVIAFTVQATWPLTRDMPQVITP